MINEPLLFAALVDLTIHPEKHDQNIYLCRDACGTTMCLAGDVVLLAGCNVMWGTREPYTFHNGRYYSAHEAATQLLGITEEQANDLFLLCGTLDELWEAAGDITDNRVIIPEGL